LHQTIEKDLQQRRTFSRPDSSGGDRRPENRVGTNHSEPETMKEPLMATGRNVLIVEDDRDFVNALKTVFESRNYQVRCACDGQAGFDEIQQQKPDALVLDVMMSTLTEGFDLASRCRFCRLRPSAAACCSTTASFFWPHARCPRWDRKGSSTIPPLRIFRSLST